MNGRKAEYPLELAAEHANRRLQQVDDEGSLYNIRSQAQLGQQTADPVMRAVAMKAWAAAIPDGSSNSCSVHGSRLLRLLRSCSAKDWTQCDENLEQGGRCDRMASGCLPMCG